MTFTKPSKAIQKSLFPILMAPTSVADLESPETYTGLAGFHKYWGKKPVESLSYLIENCTGEGDIVLDPFLGSGLISLECLKRNRRFIGVDINPCSVEHASFLLNLPSKKEYYQALIEIEQGVANEINGAYKTNDNRVVSHYLWENGKIVSIWIKLETGRNRIEIEPSQKDFDHYLSYQDYTAKRFRNLRFFTNTRINVKPGMSVSDVFTGRAMRNIDLLIESFSGYPIHLKRALHLTLTSASGQMSNMVFAIKNRANKLLKALPEKRQAACKISNDPVTVGSTDYNAWLINSDCRTVLRKMPPETVSFVCTDPPHSDRIPYLELSELWNSLLGYNVDFEGEIVVSNAKERQKSKGRYNSEMTEFFIETAKVLKPYGYIALYFNARDEESWQYLKCIEKTSDLLKFIGCFPIAYSATSVVQDNRKGAMKRDYVIVYQKQRANDRHTLSNAFTNIPGWSYQFPEKNEGKAK